VSEDGLHQRVEARRGFVEKVQLGRGGERRNECDLLTVALGVCPPFFGRVELEHIEEVPFAPLILRAVPDAAEPAEQVDGLAAGEVGPQAHVAGNVGQPRVDGDGIRSGVRPKNGCATPCRPREAQQDSDRRRLTGAVRAEEAVNLTGLDIKVEAVESVHPTIVFVQLTRCNHRAHAADTTPARAGC
jgi:hypothetical protein